MTIVHGLSQMAPNRRIDANTAAAYLAGNLPSTRVAAIEQHIDECEACRRHLSEVVCSGFSAVPSHPSVHPGGFDLTGRSGSTGLVLGSGARVGRYIIEATLGAGAMGIVYRAFDPELSRGVALKMVQD